MPRPVSGTSRSRFALQNGSQQVDLHATLDIRPLVVQPRHDFPVTHWWRPETIYEHYDIEPFGERWWQLAEAYIRNLVAHGNNVIFVQQLFPRREFVRRPAQLVKITCPSPGQYEFDWSDVRRLVRLARECGATHFEWSHLWIYWGVRHAMPVYTTEDGQAVPLWPADTDGHGELYTNFLRQFLPSFHQFLQEEKLLECSYFHLSDEPAAEHIANYRRARQTLHELAPWMKVMDALSDVEYGRQTLTDMPIPMVSAAQAYIDEKIPHWVYYCCAPRGPYLNRFLDTPLAKIRMSGWLFYRLRAQGFLHWGYNCWQKLEQDAMIDPFTEGAAGLWPDIPYGDPFVVYPGPDGPLDSIRWEVFAESLEDYAMLQTAGVDPDDPLLDGIRTYADFPQNRSVDHRGHGPACSPHRSDDAHGRSVFSSVLSKSSYARVEHAQIHNHPAGNGHDAGDLPDADRPRRNRNPRSLPPPVRSQRSLVRPCSISARLARWATVSNWTPQPSRRRLTSVAPMGAVPCWFRPASI